MLPYAKLKETDASDIQQLVALYAAAFFRWRTAGNRTALPLERAFTAWWNTKGPTRIPTTDIRVIKQDIFTEILTVHNQKGTTSE